MNKVSDALISKVRSIMADNLIEHEEVSIKRENYISVISVECNVHYSTNQACTAGMRQSGMEKWANKNTPAFLISSLMYGGRNQEPLQEEESGKAFIDWLVNRSPYASAFISKDVTEILERGSLVCDAKVSSSIIIGGLMASRVMWEYTYICKAWYELTSRGCNENLSFLLAHFASYSNGLVSFSNACAHHKSTYHWGVNNDYVISFINSKPVRLEPPFSDKATYNNISATWGDDGGKVLFDLCGKVEGAGKLKNNIFAAAVVDNKNACDVQIGFDQLAVLAKEFMEDLK